MNKDFYKISEIISKKINGTISEDETALLDNWLSENTENQELFERLSKGKVLEKKFDIYDAIDTDKGWSRYKRIVSRKNTRKHLRLWYSAAAVVLIGLIATTALFVNNEDINNQKRLADILPGSSKAILLTDKGKKIELTNNVLDITTEDGVEINNIKNNIRYHAEGIDGKINKYHKIIIPKGGEYTLELADRTKIWVNSETILSFPISFSGDERKVFLEGEAYFEVAKDAEHPFIVVTPNETIRVLGTKFNVSAYKDDNCSRTTLVEGAVEVKSTEKDIYKKIIPGQQAVVDYDSGGLTVRDVKVSKYTDWIEGRFVFEDETLGSIMRRISRWYNVKVHYNDKNAENLKFTGNFIRYDKITTILDMFEMTKRVRFSYNNDIIIVEINQN